MNIFRRDINKQLKEAHDKGKEIARKDLEADHTKEITELKNNYDIIIQKLHVEIRALERRIDEIIARENDAIEKDRKANHKFIQAQEIVLSVQQVMDSISETFIRGKDDLFRLRDRIDRNITGILENNK